jgi:hypothetical protein
MDKAVLLLSKEQKTLEAHRREEGEEREECDPV